MKLQKKTLISVVVATLLIFSVAGLLLLRESRKISPEAVLKILHDKADLEVKNVLYREVRDDNAKWEIRADKASYMKKEDQSLFDNVEVTLHLSDGRTFVMTGDKGQMNMTTKDMKISGAVKIISEGGERFETDYLQYSHVEEKLHTGAAVVMRTSRMQVSGVGMSLSLAKKDMALLSRVHARIK